MIFRPIFSLHIGALILGLGLVWAGLILSYFMYLPFASYMGPSPAILSWIGSTALLALIGIPVFSLMMWLTRWFSSYRLPSNIKAPLRIGWFTSLMIVSFMAFDIGSDHSEVSEVTTVDEFNISSPILHINGIEQKDRTKVKVLRLFDNIQYTKKGILSDDIAIHMKKAKGSLVKVEITTESRGSTEHEAQQRAKLINAQHIVEDNTLSLSQYFTISRKSKLRSQRVSYHIEIPEGMQVSFAPEVASQIRWTGGFEENCYCDESEYVWTMGADGFYSEAWLDKYRATKEIKLAEVSTINLQGDFEITILEGAENVARIKGRKADIEKLEYVATADAISFIKDGHFRGNVRIEIITPSPQSITAKDVESLTIKGYKQKQMEIIYDSYGDLKAYIDVEDLTCEMSGRGVATLIGSGQSLEVLLENARVDAQKYKTEHTTITGRSRGHSSIYASTEVKYDDQVKYELEVFGNPQKTVLPSTE